MKKYIPLFIIGTLIFTACEVFGVNPDIKRRAVGEWVFVRAYYSPTFSFSQEDKIELYGQRKLTLTDDSRVVYEMNDKDEIYEGWWEIEYISDDMDDDCGTETHLNMFLSRQGDNKSLTVVWRNFSANAKKMKGLEASGGGDIHFMLMHPQQVRTTHSSRSN
ncbi:hypothetical protein JYT72_00005 [Crocinitomix catalasitica]|nr:hypothetical protein [Crocinitomix catalasitica]